MLLAPTYSAYIVRLVAGSRGGMRDLCGWSSLASRKCQGLPREKSGVASFVRMGAKGSGPWVQVVFGPYALLRPAIRGISVLIHLAMQPVGSFSWAVMSYLARSSEWIECVCVKKRV